MCMHITVRVNGHNDDDATALNMTLDYMIIIPNESQYFLHRTPTWPLRQFVCCILCVCCVKILSVCRCLSAYGNALTEQCRKN